MNNFQILITIFFFIFLGYIAKRKTIANEEFAKSAIKLLFFFPLPVLVFLSFATTRLDTHLLIFPFISILIQSILIVISYLIGKKLKFEKESIGTLIAASGITSTLVFALPFIQSFYGIESLKYLFMYDFGNGLMAWTVVYLLTGYFGNKRGQGLKKGVANFAKNPMIYALLLGLFFSLGNIGLPEFLVALKSPLSGLINPLLFISIGALLEFTYFMNKRGLTKLFLSSGIIIGISVLLAYVFTNIFAITGIAQKIILISAASPAATLAVVFSVEHNLDHKFASALVAFTIVIGLIVVPCIIFL